MKKNVALFPQCKCKVTFKLIDLEDPESYRSIFYGRSVWLQIVPGQGDPTWKQGSVLGARVHGPGMLPTVVIDPNDSSTASSSMIYQSGRGGGQILMAGYVAGHDTGNSYPPLVADLRRV